MKAGRLVVRSHDPLRHKVLLSVASVLVILALVGAYELGVYQGGYNRVIAAQQQARLQERLAGLESEKKELQEQMTILKRSQAIDSQAYNEVRDSLKQLQESILELRQEVEFYRGIVSPSERQAGLAIQSFHLEAAVEEGLYHYELVLTQVLKNDKYVKGRVNLYIDGVQGGEPVRVQFRDISPNNSVKRDFRFRYFQRTEGDIRLPEGFVPRDVVVEMLPKGRKAVTKSFAWPVAQTL